MDEVLRNLERDFFVNPTDENAETIFETNIRLGNVEYAQWLMFIRGHWTLEPPTKPGVYQRATRNTGEPVWPPIMVYEITIDNKKQLRAFRNITEGDPVDVWKGYWWSESMPELQKAPEIKLG